MFLKKIKPFKSHLFVISHFNGHEKYNGINYTQYDLYEIFYRNTEYIELSLKSFNKLKAFL